jgi:hypothetical protein
MRDEVHSLMLRANKVQIQELSGFGHLLSSFIGKDLSTVDYEHLNRVM